MKTSTEEVRKILQGADIDVDLATVGEDESLREAGVDSLDMASLYLAVEQHYGLEIPDEDTEELDSISALAAYVGRKEDAA
jgi:acyl carrier protein